MFEKTLQRIYEVGEHIHQQPQTQGDHEFLDQGNRNRPKNGKRGRREIRDNSGFGRKVLPMQNEHSGTQN